MEIIIRGEPKEIAALVSQLHERQEAITVSNNISYGDGVDLGRLMDGITDTLSQGQEVSVEQEKKQGETITDEAYFSMKRVADLNRAFDILVEVSKNRIDEFSPALASAYCALNPAFEQVVQEEAKHLASL